MVAVLIEQAQTWLQQQQPLHLAFVLGALYFVSSLAASLFQSTARWIKVGLGTRQIPLAPGGNWLIGNVIQLATNCPWEQMHEWVRNSPPLVRFRVFHRTGIVVGDAHAVKRIFQVRGNLFRSNNQTTFQNHFFNRPPSCLF
jgi:hypothetical protein